MEMVDEAKCPICKDDAQRHTEFPNHKTWFWCENCARVSVGISETEILNRLGVMPHDLSQEPALFGETLENLRRARRNGRI